MRLNLFILFSLLSLLVFGQQQTKKALFIGNSYTSVNNLPQMTANITASAGDELLFDSNTPGGYTLKMHSTTPQTLIKIGEGDWDYVVLQEQSQWPSFPLPQVESEVFPYAAALNDLIKEADSCTETVFYMTWGRKNGDSQNCPGWPPVCTYEGMDDLLNERYRTMAEDNDALLSPVGAVWRYIRENYSDIELYSGDGSHPSLIGTYVAALTFYTVFYRNNPEITTYNPGISEETVNQIKQAVKMVVFEDLMEWHIGEYDPNADFTYEQIENLEIAFTNTSVYADEFEWHFGDGHTSNEENPIHQYLSPGNYEVKLTCKKCGLTNEFIQTITVNSMKNIELNENNKIRVYPNPVSDRIYFSVPDGFKGEKYFLFDLNGKLIKSGKLNSENIIIDIGALPEGVYILKIGTENNNAIRILKSSF